MRISPLVAGSIIGILAAFVQSFLKVYPPIAYGICMIGHARDLVNSIVNHLVGTKLFVQPASAEIPVLTVLGILIGASLTALAHKEFKLQRGRSYISVFMLGFIVVNFGLILGGCPIRATLLVAYGSLLMTAGIASIAVGVVLGSAYLRWRGKTQ